MATPRRGGTLALLGGGEWRDGCRDLDAELIAASAAREVVVIPAAAAYEHPERVAGRATTYFESLGIRARTVPVVHRPEAEDPKIAEIVRRAKFIYLADGSPLHLRSVLKGSAVFEAVVAAYHGGAALAASGAGATLVGDPMVDPRGGAYTVGLGLVANLAVFPYHGTAADHLRERSIDLLPASAKLVGIDEETALVRDRDGSWRVAGVGVVTVYAGRAARVFASGDVVTDLV
ncbi:MAG: Type 1 glutamine amidotransferase-like domain-containing protein [Acidimicrobiia bacterium]|jgi:cyanophycinase